MANLKRDLVNECNHALIEIFDSFDKYDDIDQARVQKQIKDLQELAKSLEHYDDDDKKKKGWFQKGIKKWSDLTDAFFGKKK